MAAARAVDAVPRKLARPIRQVVLARLVSSTGVEAAFFLGLWGKAAYVLDGTPTDLAVMSALIGVAAMGGSVIGGSLVDRFDARRVVVGAEALFIPATLAMILATDITQLVAFGLVSWLAGAALETAIVSLPPVLVTPDRLEMANARLEAANWLALMAGPAIGAALVARAGVDSVFVFDAATSAAALVLIARVRVPDRSTVAAPVVPPPGKAPTVESRSGLADTVAGLRYAWMSPPIRLALYLGAIPGLAFGMFVALEPLFYRDVVGAEVEVLGYVNALFGLGLLAGSVGLERTSGRFTGFHNLVLLTVLGGVGSVVYVATPDMAVILTGAVLWSVPLGAALPMMRTLAQRAAADAFVGRVMGALGTVSAGAAIVPLVFAPALSAWIGVQRVLIASGGVAVLAAPLVWRWAGRLDRATPVSGASPAPMSE